MRCNERLCVKVAIFDQMRILRRKWLRLRLFLVAQNDFLGVTNDSTGVTNDSTGVANDSTGVANGWTGGQSGSVGVSSDSMGVTNDSVEVMNGCAGWTKGFLPGTNGFLPVMNDSGRMGSGEGWGGGRKGRGYDDFSPISGRKYGGRGGGDPAIVSKAALRRRRKD